MTALIDFSRLPAPQAVRALDYEAVLATGLSKLRELLPGWDADLESDPAKKLIEVFAYLDLILRGRINDAIRALLLAHATAGDLEQLAANVAVRRLPGERDARLRERTQQALWSVAAADPAAAYRWHALSVSSDIRDVSVTSTATGQVTVTVLAPQSAPPDASAEELAQGLAAFGRQETVIARVDDATLLAVRDALDAETVRPLTDAVTVRPPRVRPFAVQATLHLYPGPDAALVEAEARAALAAYLTTLLRMGYDATRAGLIAALVVPGVQDVELTAPAADIGCSDTELALAVTVALGVEAQRRV